jgi:adenine deaminase
MRIDINAGSFEIGAEQARLGSSGDHRPDNHQILLISPKVDANGRVAADTDKDVLKMAVVENQGHRKRRPGIGTGIELHSGALATSVAHDSHNIAVVGVDSAEMLSAVLAVKEMNGGLVVVKEGRAKASLALPVAGLLSERYMRDVADGIDDCIDAARELGCKLKDPFMTLSFLCLPVIPELKLTDKGLVDVNKFSFVPLFIENA